MTQPATPVLLARHSRFYRDQAAERQRWLDNMADTARKDSGYVAWVTRERDLWTQLAEELDAYLDDADAPGLFDVDGHDSGPLAVNMAVRADTEA